MKSKMIGEISEAKILADLVSHGYKVSIPFGEDCRYDLVIEDSNGTLKKVQCKTGRFRDGAIVFHSFSVDLKSQLAKDYVGQVDYFAVYCFETNLTYLVPMTDDLPLREVSMRVIDSKNNQKSRIRLASQYQIR